MYSERIMHHSTGQVDKAQQTRVMKEVTAAQVTVTDPSSNRGFVDEAFATALSRRKPSFIQIPVNIAGLSSTALGAKPVQHGLLHPIKDEAAFNEAVQIASEFLRHSERTFVLIGSKLSTVQSDGLESALVRLASALPGCSVAVQPDGKGEDDLPLQLLFTFPCSIHFGLLFFNLIKLILPPSPGRFPEDRPEFIGVQQCMTLPVEH